MKKIIIIILLGMFIFPYFLQAQVLDTKKSLYQNKVISFTKMKRTGVGITIGGTILTAVGIGLMVDAVNKSNNYGTTNYYSTDSNDRVDEALIGYVGFFVGVAATGTGIALWAIGGSRAKNYQKKMNLVSLNLNSANHQIFSLAYHF